MAPSILEIYDKFLSMIPQVEQNNENEYVHTNTPLFHSMKTPLNSKYMLQELFGDKMTSLTSKTPN